jgi:hypothetical protein
MVSEAERARTVTCDACGETFAIEVQDEPLEGGGRRIYFVCPHCHKVYTPIEADAERAKLLKEAEQLRWEMVRAQKQRRIGQLRRLLARWERVQEALSA